MLFTSKKSMHQYGVVFEIGSGSVAGAIVSINETLEHPVIVYAAREFLSLKEINVSSDISKRLISIFMSTALEVESKLSQMLPRGKRPDAIYVNFTAPWTHTRGALHTYKTNTPVVVTSELLQKIQDSVTEPTNTKSKAEAILSDNNYTIINCTITGYTANNYPIANPVGQTVSSITLTETVSAVTNTLYTPTLDIINKIFSPVPVVSVTSPLIQQHLMRTLITTPTTYYATIHLTHEALELCVYRNNQITAAFTTAIGINTIARTIATVSKIPHEQVYSLLTSDNLSLYQDSLVEKIKDTFTSEVALPLSSFFSHVHAQEFLPKEFILIATLTPSPVLETLIQKTLTQASKGKFTLTNLRAPLIHSTAEANIGSNDLGISTLAYFFHNHTKND